MRELLLPLFRYLILRGWPFFSEHGMPQMWIYLMTQHSEAYINNWLPRIPHRKPWRQASKVSTDSLKMRPKENPETLDRKACSRRNGPGSWSLYAQSLAENRDVGWIDTGETVTSTSSYFYTLPHVPFHICYSSTANSFLSFSAQSNGHFPWKIHCWIWHLLKISLWEAALIVLTLASKKFLVCSDLRMRV